MASPPKPWKAEYAKSSRSSCKTCKTNIDKEVFRLGKMVTATQFDGFMPMWNHGACILKKANQIKSVDDVEGIDLLRWEDQQKIRKYVEGGSISTAPVAANECAIELSQTSRASCRRCNQKIMKGDVRVATKPDGQGSKGLAWHHAGCFMEMCPSTEVEKLSGWDGLNSQDKEAVQALTKKGVPAAKTVSKVQSNDNKELAQQSASKGTKRKKALDDQQKTKIPKAEGSMRATSQNGSESENRKSGATDVEKLLEEQTKSLWTIKDDLKKHVTTAEMREMLEANGQDATGSEFDLRDRCADGMLFGALESCPICSGSLRYSGGKYHCLGYASAWSKCSFSTTEPVRCKEKWKIPDETNNQYLTKWFKSQKGKKPDRILPPPSSSKATGSEVAPGSCQPSKSERLEDLKVAFSGLRKESLFQQTEFSFEFDDDINPFRLSKNEKGFIEAPEEWRNKIEGAGGMVHPKTKKETNCLVVSGELDDNDPEVRKARRMKVPVVRENYLVDCFQKKKMLPPNHYRVESESSRNDVMTVKVKGRSAVHEASGLQDSGHILEDGTSIYNTTLNMSDLSTGINSYYILQIIQEDKGSDCYVFRKWGRVGNEKIGGNKLLEMSKSDAIQEFKRLFLEKTGNPWEAWEKKQNFEKQPGRFFPLEIDYGVNKQVSKKKDQDNSKSKLPPQVIELIKMLFDVETYRTAMMEFEINMSEMPLGKLSKRNIRKGFEVLTELQNLLTSNQYEPSVKESLIIDASNRFFTMIPSIHPHIIRDDEDFKSKVKMLEALQDIEIASRLVGFDAENDDSIDDKYKKLHCCINPLPHDCEDYRLIEKYLLTTHAPTHKDWSLELEEVYSLDREGEFDKFATYRQKLKNRMLLWHGSRLTNFIGILSQGLRIAPPEAPTTGYMFGKGIYFADLVSKSAQYCYTDKRNPVGLMLLSEVALGEVYELKKASYIERPPEGKHSTKGLGKKIPRESDYVKWRDEVVVPCGKPVDSAVRASELMYNEYIVYNTAQVKMQFLLKVRFHHKR